MILNKNSTKKNVMKLVINMITIRQLRFRILFISSPSLPIHCRPKEVKFLLKHIYYAKIRE